MINKIIFIIFFLFNFVYSDDTGSCGDSCTYTFTESTGEMVFYGQSMSTSYETRADRPWNSYEHKIKSVRITGTLWLLGKRSFDNCTNLETVDLGVSLSLIGVFAFRDCVSLKSIVVV